MKDAERIQYYASDLAYALDIGEIADMYVVTENGTQILRMTVIPKKHDEFKTMRAAPVKDTRKTVKRKYIPREPTPGIIRMQGQENPERLGERMMNYGKGFMKNISKPLFMNR